MSAIHTLRAATSGAMGLALLMPIAALGQPAFDVSSDAYEDALGLARLAMTPFEMDAAICVLSNLLPRYPQDVDLPLELGSLLYRRDRFRESLHLYELARARSIAGGEADLGIGWALFKLGRYGEAAGSFRAVLATKPDDRSAKEGLALCTQPPISPTGKRVVFGPLVAQSVYLYRDHPLIDYALASTARLDARVADRYYAAVTYRYSYFSPSRSSNGHGSNGSGANGNGSNEATAAWSQHDVYADFGINLKSLGATLHYALVDDGSDYAGTSHHIGITGRYSSFVDIFLNLSASFYSDESVLRSEVSVRIPIYAGISLRPAGAVQWTSGSFFNTAALTLLYYHPRVSLWLGGKLGDERRAAYLNVGYVYIGPQRVPYGLWAGAAVYPGAKFSLSLGYNLDRLVRSDVTPPEDSTVHSLTLALSRDF
jgi:tetratricopeptide (TPR) repeat protein